MTWIDTLEITLAAMLSTGHHLTAHARTMQAVYRMGWATSPDPLKARLTVEGKKRAREVRL
jgi:hypothetical protein